jgi:hypothetical protein
VSAAELPALYSQPKTEYSLHPESSFTFRGRLIDPYTVLISSWSFSIPDLCSLHSSPLSRDGSGPCEYHQYHPQPYHTPAAPGPCVTTLKIQVMVDTSRPDPYNSSESYRRLLTSVFAPVPKSECSKLCNTQYMPAAVAAAYDESLSPEQPISARAQLSGICCRAFLSCQARAAPSHRVPLDGFSQRQSDAVASSDTSSPYFEGKIMTSFRPCCFKTWSGIFDGSRNVASQRGSVYG